MSYGFDLARLAPGLADREEAYRKMAAGEPVSVNRLGENIGPLDPAKEQVKERLAAALIARHPSLKRFHCDYASIAKEESTDESEARRRYRTVELNDKKRWVQIVIFDDEAGLSFSLGGSGAVCRKTLRMIWDCLEILETQGGFSTFDPQMNRLLDLSADFEMVAGRTCKPGEQAGHPKLIP